MEKLFAPLNAGELKLRNRIVMAPLTRSRASGPDSRTPNDLMLKYYTQRASAGMILTEATIVTPMGAGYERTPGIYTDEQVEGWKKITAAVHKLGGTILCQLWHVGRISDPSLLNGQTPVAPSAIKPAGHVSLLRPVRPYVTPRALETAEVAGVVEAFRKGAENAQRAGFDGVEIHGANGYLIDQFLQDGTNTRQDQYGGPVENRARLMMEITDAAIGIWGAGRVGMHIAPRSDSQDMSDSNPAQTFGYVARELGRRKIAFLCARESLKSPRLGPDLKKQFGGVYIANEGFTQETAEQVLANGEADAVAFGRLFIANPNLPEKFREHSPLKAPNPQTFYSHEAEGYTDY